MKHIQVRMGKRYLVIFIFLLLNRFPAYSMDPAADFLKANELYKAKNYVAAAAKYEQLLKEQYVNSEVYYNLGNCYYRLDQNPKAILFFEAPCLFAGVNNDEG